MPRPSSAATSPPTADYRDPYVAKQIAEQGWAIWPPIRFDYQHDQLRPRRAGPVAADRPPISLGTDDQGRDVAARLIYGLRISILFGLALTVVSSVIGVGAGAVQGYFGGLTDLVVPALPRNLDRPARTLRPDHSWPSLLVPGFWTLLGILALFSWVSLVGVVRAEFLRARNFDYVRAARALGMNEPPHHRAPCAAQRHGRHLHLLPFITNGSIASLTSLDFLGLGLPPGSASLGDLLRQGKENLQAPWLGITGFLVLAVTLSLLVFIGEAVRDAFDPRKTNL